MPDLAKPMNIPDKLGGEEKKIVVYISLFVL